MTCRFLGRRFHLLDAGRSTVGCFDTATTSLLNCILLCTWLAIAVHAADSDLIYHKRVKGLRVGVFVGSSKNSSICRVASLKIV